MKSNRKAFVSNPRKLTVYSKSIRFVREIYDVVETYPEFEKYVMSDQLRRSVTSIVANIAEGNQSYYYPKEFSHLDIALASTAEVRAFIDMSLLMGYITSNQHKKLDSLAEEIVRMLIGKMKSVSKQMECSELEGTH